MIHLLSCKNKYPVHLKFFNPPSPSSCGTINGSSILELIKAALNVSQKPNCDLKAGGGVCRDITSGSVPEVFVSPDRNTEKADTVNLQQHCHHLPLCSVSDSQRLNLSDPFQYCECVKAETLQGRKKRSGPCMLLHVFKSDSSCVFKTLIMLQT